MIRKIKFSSIKKKLNFLRKFAKIPIKYINSNWTVFKIVLKTGVYLVFIFEAFKFIPDPDTPFKIRLPIYCPPTPSIANPY